MFKTQETKVFGSIRKVKRYGACGVILGMAALAMAFSSGTVSADELSANQNVPKTVQEAPKQEVPKQDETVKKNTTVDVVVDHSTVDKAVSEAKKAGLEVKQDSPVDAGVAESQEELAKRQTAVEKDYANQANTVSTEIDGYKKDVVDNEREKKDVHDKNEEIRQDHEKAKKELKEKNDQIDEHNKENLAKYAKEQKAYEKKLEELKKKGVAATAPNITLYGNYDETKRGSLEYYGKLTAAFSGVKDLELVKGTLGATSETTIEPGRTDMIDKEEIARQNATSTGGTILKNIKEGDWFTLHKIGKTQTGKTISVKFISKSTPTKAFEKEGNSQVYSRLWVWWSKWTIDNKGVSPFGFSPFNYLNPDFDYEFFDEATGKPLNIGRADVYSDIDYGQSIRHTYEDGSTGIVKTPSDSLVQETPIPAFGNKTGWKGVKTSGTYQSDDDTGLDEYKAGDPIYSNVNDFHDTPVGTIVSIGYGSKGHLSYYYGKKEFKPYSQEKFEAYRKYSDAERKAEGLPPYSDRELYEATYTFQLWGNNNVVETVDEVHPPELERHEKDTIPDPEYLPEPGKVKTRTVHVRYANLRYKPSVNPTKSIKDTHGNNIDGAKTFDKNVKFTLKTDYAPYSKFTASPKSIAKRFAILDDVQDGAYTVDNAKIKATDDEGKDVKQLFDMYHVLSDKGRTDVVNEILKESGFSPKGEFYMWVPKDNAAYYKNYVSKGKNVTFDLFAKLLVKEGQKVQNDFHQIDFGIDHKSNLVTAEVPDVKPEKHVLDKDGKKILDGQEVQIGQLIQYFLNGVTVPAKHDTISQYDGVDKLDVKHDRYTGNWKGIIKGTEYTAEKDLTLPYDVILKDGKVVKAGDKIAKGTSYAFTFEFNQDTNSEFIKKLVTVKWDAKDGQWSYVINQDFLNSLGVKGTFDADFYIEAERIETGDKIENTFINIVNKQEMTAKVITRTPEPPKPKHPEKHALDKTGQKVLDGKEVQLGDFVQYLLDGATVPERHHMLYQYDGVDKLDMKHDRYTGNWKGIIKGTEYTAEKDLTLPYDVILKDGKVVKAGDKIAKGTSYAFTFEFNQDTNSEFIKKLVTVKWDAKDGQWSYVINQDFLNSLGVKGTFDADFYIEAERIETGDKIENTFINIVNKQEMTAKVITRTPEPPKPKHPEKHALDKTGQKVLDGKEVQMGELIQYLLDGATVPERHHTLYQYDGVDKLDMKHDRYTGNWKGVIKGTEYTAEKDLILPYDVILKDGKVVKAGDKIAKGSSYAFTFEFNQDTNSEFIKKIVKVKWNEQDGKWAYTIDKEFLNSLGVRGTFDADFYVEVERIASGEVENTFVNIVNGKEMDAKVTTTTPEPPAPEEPRKPQPQPALPNTGTASSMLGFVGIGILSMLGLVGLKRKKEVE